MIKFRNKSEVLSIRLSKVFLSVLLAYLYLYVLSAYSIYIENDVENSIKKNMISGTCDYKVLWFYNDSKNFEEYQDYSQEILHIYPYHPSLEEINDYKCLPPTLTSGKFIICFHIY